MRNTVIILHVKRTPIWFCYKEVVFSDELHQFWQCPTTTTTRPFEGHMAPLSQDLLGTSNEIPENLSGLLLTQS
jgi:hypothetical protein